MYELMVPEYFCSLCQTSMKPDHIFCVNCGFPEKGTDDEKSRYHARRVMRKQKLHEASRKIRFGRNSLYVISALSLAVGIFNYLLYEDTAGFIAAAILALIYLGLGFWSQRRPLVALILGLLVYLTTIVINLVLDPESVTQGLLIKIFIIAYLAKGINSALQFRNVP